jgi:hypothetical protein
MKLLIIDKIVTVTFLLKYYFWNGLRKIYRDPIYFYFKIYIMPNGFLENIIYWNRWIEIYKKETEFY